MRGRSGFTLVELTVSLAVIAVLTAIIVPFVTRYIDDARITAAAAECKSIADAISRFEGDVGRYPFYTSGSGLLQDSNANVIRLEGPGIAPTDTTGGSGVWISTSSITVDDLVDQLVLNAPGYPTTTSLAKPFKWKGPYVTLKADPWGNKYLVNITNAKSSSTMAAFVLSAGPNGKVETNFSISETSVVSPSGDDILYRIR
jgi:prepilin-type N-terminal cleavage/methylation domain-containing protein